MVSINSTNEYQYDHVDKQILEFLQEDSKITNREIAEKTEMSQTAIRTRIQKLEDNIIKKYMAIIDCRKLGYREMVMASLRVNSRRPIEQIKEEIEKMYRIKYAYIITGDYPIFIMAKCLDHEDSMKLIENLRNLPEVEEVKTQIVLDRIKEDHTIIIPEPKS
ncbi:MAG: AsnC family transcriptional regulator [Candidatus Lokiarchaeota archaeon]|nr:AsnC family transcriptional regulator [Candidatus Lokiarchaeota archaeon]